VPVQLRGKKKGLRPAARCFEDVDL
jgi:hypothetical protein